MSQDVNSPGKVRHKLRACLGLWLLTGFTGLVCLAGPKPQTVLEQLFYDIGVIGYCGLSSDEVYAGFRRELDRIVEEDLADEHDLRRARNRAMTLVELEWDNRGLGGFRGWCRTEGELAVDRFMGVPQ